MATQEPDRGTRRRWFRLPGQHPADTPEPTGFESEALVTTEEAPEERVTPEPAPEATPTEAVAPPVGRDRAGTGGSGAARVNGRAGRGGARDAPEESRRLDAPAAGDLHRQPEGWRRQDDDRGEPRRGAGRDRLPGPGRRPRPSGQRDHGPRDQPPQRRRLDLRRHHERHAARRLRRADEREEPLRVSRRPSTSPAPRSSSCRRSPASSSSSGRSNGARDDYDFTLIDCPPSLGLLTVNGLAASDDVLVPIQCEYYALEGLGQLLRNVALVKSNLNPTLDVRGIVLTMYDARTKLADAGRARGARALRVEGLPYRRPEDRADLRGSVVRRAHHRFRRDVSWSCRLSRACEGGQPWHDPEGWVEASVH